jgi:hypothetical protein
MHQDMVDLNQFTPAPPAITVSGSGKVLLLIRKRNRRPATFALEDQRVHVKQNFLRNSEEKQLGMPCIREAFHAALPSADIGSDLAEYPSRIYLIDGFGAYLCNLAYATSPVVIESCIRQIVEQNLA